MRHGSICSGIGGLDLAVNAVFGSTTEWLVEFDKHASKVLEARFPGVPNLGDLTKIDWSQVEPVEVMSGGTPCQDLSLAGKRAGMKSGTRSGLWESMREGIAVLRPQYVVWENVKGALSAKASSDVERTEGRVGGLRALGRVLGDLASLGYDARWGVVRASDAGLPHRRERVFVLAQLSDTASVGQVWSGEPGETTGEPGSAGGATVANLPATHADSGAAGQRSGPANMDRTGEQVEGRFTSTYGKSWTGPTDGQDEAGTYGSYQLAVARAEALTRPAPEPLLADDNLKYGARLNPAFSEWIMGFPAGWVTDLDVSNSEALKMFGNAVCPQQAELALRLLLD